MIKWTKLTYFEAGESMKASEWIREVGDSIVMRCDVAHPEFSGVVAFVNNRMEYKKGEVVPVYLIFKERRLIQRHCPKCGGRGYIDEEL